MATRRPGRTTTSTTSTRGGQSQGIGQATGSAVGGAVGAAGDSLVDAAGNVLNRSGGRTAGRTASTTRASGASGDQELSVTVNREGSSGATQQSGSTRQRGSTLPNLFAPALLPGAFMANPFEFMRRMSEQMDQLLGGSMYGQGQSTAQSGGSTSLDRQRTGGTQAFGSMTGWAPQIEIVQRDDEIVVRADLPGLDRNDIDVEVNDGVLMISGERRQESRDEREGFIRSERAYGSFYRAIPLPDGVNADEISANFRDGVLEIAVPVPENQRQRRRRVEIT